MKSQRGLGVFLLIFTICFVVGFIALSIYLVRLDGVIRSKFEGQRWDIPAKVYARPLEIYNQAPLSQSNLLQELNMLGYKKADNKENPGTFFSHGNHVEIHTRGFNFGDSEEVEQILDLTFAQDQIINVDTTHPSETGITRLEPLLIGGIYPQHNEDRVLIKLANVPQPLIDALIATEDRDFYTHHGISVRGTARAVFSNLTGGRRQGGSTLTQQLIKNFFLSPEQTYKRKINEAFMAVLLEMHYSKDQILETYLNEVHLGQNGNYSINGYGLASQFYFGLPLNELNISQQAFLVGLVQGPSLYNPWRNPERAKERRNLVLNNMLIMGKLTQDQYQQEIARPLAVIEKPSMGPTRFPDFMDIVRRQLRAEYQDTDLTNQGLRIFTTLDPLAQTKVENQFKQSVDALVKRNPRVLNNLQGAVLIQRPENGELIAVVGSSEDFTGFNRALDAKRQVGSLLKPAIYINAIESGQYNWATLIPDSTVSISSGGKTWTPKNYSGGEHGMVPMVQALEHSYNLAAVNMGQTFGVPAFINNLRKFGVTSDIQPYPSAFLGAVNMSPMEVLSIYSNFATGGFKYPTKAIRAVIDQNGKVLERYGLDVQQTIDPDAAYILNYGLQEVMHSGTGQAAYRSLPSSLNLAGKSGTTNDTRDSWFAGYSGNYVTVVWLGLDNNKITGLTGSSGALPVWTSVMKQLPQQPVNIKQPDDVQWQWIDPATGYLSAQGCPNAMYVPLLAQKVPNQAISCAVPNYEVPAENPSSSDPESSSDSLEHLIQITPN
ncbi:penicillin-binding protein 1B [Acinetobacter sp. B10A]|uniref:penicillin-binding protein 1B n=1 Tax=Acinetobacter baretiae TaxID=2605383 RepID=UPI001B3C5AEE|nr:penicillin-binding protein 1B [Acinetobacter baretiae]